MGCGLSKANVHKKAKCEMDSLSFIEGCEYDENFNRYPSVDTKTTRLTEESGFDSASTIYVLCKENFDGISLSSENEAMALVDDTNSLYTVLDSSKKIKRMRLI